jgi:hypothetical protein
MRLKVEAAGRGDNVDARAEATTRRPAGQKGARRRRILRGRGGWRGGGRCEEDREEEPRRPG